MKAPLSINIVKQRIKKIFNRAFDFPHIDTEYKNTLSMVTMVCPIHGQQQKMIKALIYSKTGCVYCRRLKRTISMFMGKRFSNKEMISFYEFIKDNNIPIPADPTRVNYQKLATLYNKFRVVSGHRVI